MMEEQALCRIHRLGQKKEVKTIRYLIPGTFEEVSEARLSIVIFLSPWVWC
jgi:SNF2 family DNA or RNA helicase